MKPIGEMLLEMLVIFSVNFFNWKFGYSMTNFGPLLRGQKYMIIYFTKLYHRKPYLGDIILILKIIS